MFAVLLVVSLVMILAGSAAVFTGWEILLLERGWSMLIGGATLATGGLVLGGATLLARALARRIDTLTDAVREGHRVQAQAALPRRTAESDRPAPAPYAPPVFPPPAARMPSSTIPSPGVTPSAPARPAPAASLGLGPLAAANTAPPQASAEEVARTPVDLGKRASRPIEPEPASEPVVAATADEPTDAVDTAPALDEPAPERDEIGTVGPGIEQPVLAPQDEERTAVEAQAFLGRMPEPATPSEREEFAVSDPEPPPAPEPVEETGIEVRVEEAEEFSDGDEGAPPSPTDADIDRAPPEGPSAPTVIGRHESGANSYTMYSDGSIEAQTPDGRYVFGSLEEFRGWIASAGQDPSGTTNTSG